MIIASKWVPEERESLTEQLMARGRAECIRKPKEMRDEIKGITLASSSWLLVAPSLMQSFLLSSGWLALRRTQRNRRVR